MLHASGVLGAGALLIASVMAATPPPRIAVTTHHNDNARTGANPHETALTASTVAAGFGKLFTRTVDGQIAAQPLYVSRVAIAGRGARNVVYVCTQHNSVYAFDADDPAAPAPFWRVNLGTPVPAQGVDSTRDILVEIGIASTPAIDLESNTLYVVSATYENRDVRFRLHALDLGDGREHAGGPVDIAGDVVGRGGDAQNGRVAFRPRMHWQRPGLLLANGLVYVAFGSHQDAPPFHGWVFAYDATTLRRAAVRCLSPDTSSTGVWQGGVGLSADPAGSVYVVTGDGLLTAERGGRDYGDSVVKLSGRDLSVLDYFSPSDQASLRSADRDLGTTGAMLIPGSARLVTGAKDGRLFVLDRNSLGGFHESDRAIQSWRPSRGFFGGTVYHNGTLYAWGIGDRLKAFRFDGSVFTSTPSAQSSMSVPFGFAMGPALAVSSNGTAPGTGILWATYATDGRAEGGAHPGILRAFDADDVSRELWNSDRNRARDASGSWSKWCPPTIAGGKVYVATFDKALAVYGRPSAAGGRP